MWIGSTKENKAKPLGIKWPNEPVKALGVYYTYDVKLGGSNPQVTGHGSWVTGHGSQVAGHRLQVSNIIIIWCSARGKNKTCLLFKNRSLIYNFSVVINNFSVLIVLYYILKSDGCPFIISLTCDIKADCF